MGFGPKLLLGLLFMFIACTIVSNIVDGIWFTPSDISATDDATAYTINEVQGDGYFAVPKLSPRFFIDSFPKWISFDYSYLSEGEMTNVRFILITLFGTIFVYGLAITFISAIQGLFGK
jgi:hypothetical protein